MDRTFRALAHPARRKMLDLLKAGPGMNVNDLSEYFDFSRFAVMKHLKVLEDAGLVVSRRSGNSRLLYLNAVPIQTIYDRWMSSYSALWAPQLTQLKYRLERKGREMKESKPKHVFQVYILTSADELWRSLTDPEQTRRYYFNTAIKSELSPGAKVEYLLKGDDGADIPVVIGEILESIPNKKLVHTFAFTNYDDPPSRVTFEIEEMGPMVKLTVIHDDFEQETKTYQEVGGGWPLLLSSLKSMLETGQALPASNE